MKAVFLGTFLILAMVQNLEAATPGKSECEGTMAGKEVSQIPAIDRIRTEIEEANTHLILAQVALAKRQPDPYQRGTIFNLEQRQKAAQILRENHMLERDVVVTQARIEALHLRFQQEQEFLSMQQKIETTTLAKLRDVADSIVALKVAAAAARFDTPDSDNGAALNLEQRERQETQIEGRRQSEKNLSVAEGRLRILIDEVKTGIELVQYEARFPKEVKDVRDALVERNLAVKAVNDYAAQAPSFRAQMVGLSQFEKNERVQIYNLRMSKLRRESDASKLKVEAMLTVLKNKMRMVETEQAGPSLKLFEGPSSLGDLGAGNP